MTDLFARQPFILSSEIVYRGFVNVRHDHLQLPNGPDRLFTTIQTEFDAAAIVAETEDDKLVIISEYRHAANEWLLGCPGGRLDPGEDPLTGAQRELIEETGYASEEWVELGPAFPFPGLCNQKIFFFLAKNARFVKPPTLEPFELIEPLIVTKKELYHQIASGSPVDGILCTALMLRSLSS